MYRHLCELSSYWKITLTLLCSVMISACATTSQQTKVEQDISQSAGTDKAEPPAEVTETQQQQNLPNMDLDAELLEQLLVYNLASHQGDWQLAVKNAVAAAQASRDPRLAHMATLIALRIKDYQQAAGVAQLWAELESENSDASGTLLLAQVGAGMVEPALEGFSKLKADKDLDDFIKEVAGLLIRQTNPESALDIVKHYIQQYPESEQVLLSSSYVASSFNQTEQAAEWLDQVLLIKPDWDLAAQMKTSALRKQGNNEAVIAYVKQFVERNPN